MLVQEKTNLSIEEISNTLNEKEIQIVKDRSKIVKRQYDITDLEGQKVRLVMTVHENLKSDQF